MRITLYIYTYLVTILYSLYDIDLGNCMFLFYRC